MHRGGVAPFAGVWIEIISILKVLKDVVAPFAGVWIEIKQELQIKADVEVAPFAGVWIEIECSARIYIEYCSRTLRGCVD